MNYLLDTHVLLWWLNNDKNLGSKIRQAISDDQNKVYVSVINFWEISIKLKSNPRFKLKTPFEVLLDIFDFPTLDVKLNHVNALHKLPLKHKDPFDRMLISQAQAENMTLITGDQKIFKYENVEVLKA